jgi:pimeloyl-ACP methyl ester carboxylesterase
MRFLLVHGAFHGAWCWEPVIRELEAAGHSATAVDLPGAGEDTTAIGDVTLDSYADRVCAALAVEEAPVVVVGHSMGGMAITQAAASCGDRMSALIYVCAFLPGDGQSLVELTELPEGAGDMVQANMIVEGEPPVATMPRGPALEAFYGMCGDEQAMWAVKRIQAQPLAPFVAPASLGKGADDGPPRFYIVSTQDKSIPPALQRRMARERATAEVAEIEADHSPFLSATGELVGLLERFAGAADSQRSLTQR